MPFADDLPVNPPGNSPSAADDLYAPFGGGQAQIIEAAPLDVGPTAWSDVPKGFVAGYHGTLADAAGFVAATAEGPATKQAAQEYATQQLQAQQEAEQGLSPAAQRPGFFSHPLVSTAEAAPGIIGVGVPTAVATTVAGPFGGALVGSVLMGGQQLGTAQNRAAEQGVELTPAQKAEQFGIGATAGVVPELGIPGKLAVSPLIKLGLGVTTDAGAFGASSAAGEVASQKAEIDAGKRTGYDYDAIIAAGKAGMEQGAGFHGVLHAPGVLKKLKAGTEAKTPGATTEVDNTQTPGETTNKRTPREYPKEEAQPATPADTTTPPENKGPPQPTPENKGVGPAETSALTPDALGTSVTRGVSELQPTGVEQPPVVQPAPVVAPSEPSAAPEQRITEQPAGAPAEPRPDALEARPAALPREDVTAVQLEPRAAYEEQHAALLDPSNPREAMVYEKGDQPIEITDKSAIGQVKLRGGQIVQYVKNGPSNFTPDKIRQYAKDDRLNEALGLGPVTKTEALQRAAAGETPVAVTERTPAGTEVKAAAGTTETAPAQQAALEAVKAPENVTAVERPEDVIADRQAAVAQEQAVQPKVVPDYPQGKAPVALTGRVLEAQGEAEQRARDQAIFEDRQQALRVQDELKRKAAAQQEAAETKRSHTAKAAQIKIAADNIAARRIVDANPAPPVVDNVKRPTQIYDRAKAIVAAAKEAKIDIPKEFPEGHPHSGAMLVLREAADLTSKRDQKWEAYARFLDREKMVNAGRSEEAFAARRNEGALGLGSPEAAPEERVVPPSEIGTYVHEAQTPETDLMRKEEEEEGGEGGGEEEPIEHGEWDIAADAPKQDILRKIEAAKAIARDQNIGLAERENAQRGVERLQQALANQRGEPRVDAFAKAREERDAKLAAARAESEAMRKEAPAQPKAATGFQVAKKGRFTIKRSMEEEPETHGRAKQVMLLDDNGDPVGITPSRTSTAEEAIKEHYDPKAYDKEQQQLNEHLIKGLNKYAGDVPAHYLPRDEMHSTFGKGVNGFYAEDASGKPVIFLAEGADQQTAIHEALHAATSAALDASPEFKGLMDRLHQEVRNSDDFINLSAADKYSISYPMSDPEEFLVGLMTNPKVQRLLKQVKISEQLARDIGIPKWRKMTGWNAALHIIQKALGLGTRDVSAIEAAMSITEQAMWQHPRGAGDLMEASGRLDRATAAERAAPVTLSRIKFSREPPERDQEAFLKSPTEHLASIKGIDREFVKQYAKDTAGNLGTNLLGKTAKFLSGTHLSDLHGKIFTDAKGNIIEAINRARDKVSHMFNELRRGDRDIINRGYLLDQKYKSNMRDYADLLNMSSRYNIHADREAPKVPKNPEDAARKNWQRDANYDKARALYDSLPEELQKRYRDEKAFYQNKQKELATTVLNKILPILDLPKDMEERVRNNDMTDVDRRTLDDRHALDAIEAAHRLINKQDVYFPGKREGNFVVTGRYEMPKGGAATDFAGEQLADNKREFDTEKEAHEYVTKTHMPATVRETTYWTDPATGKTERRPAGEAASTGKITNKYEVSLERQHTEFHDSHAEATKARAEMEKAGVGELSGVLDRRNDKSYPRDQTVLTRRVMNRDDLNDAEKQHLIESIRQLGFGSQNGMAPHLMNSRKVAGAQFDNAQGLDRYSRAINHYIARNAHSVELAQAMDRLDEHENKNRGDASATTRSIIANTMRDRVADQNAGLNAKVSPLLHRLMTMSFINFLVRPSHIFLSQVHPYVYSVPMMAARHGYWGAVRAQRQAMADLGGQLANLGRGFKAGVDVAKSLREKDTEKAVQLAHGADPIHEMIARLSNKDERDALMRMYETQHLHSAYDQSMFTGGGIDRTNVMMQQFTNAMEANNRLSTALAAYRLEKARTGDSAHSLAYAQRVIEETHGIYSASNAAPIFKNPLMRATLQFHQQPMNLAFMLYRNAYKAFKGDTEARWTLAYQLGTAALLGGMGGMPMDLPKLAGLATQPVTGMAPSDYYDKMTRELTDTLGATATHAIMDGLPGLMGPLGPSLGHRMGFDAGLLNDEPKSASGGDIMTWAAKNVAGAPGGMLMDWLDALHSLESGDLQKMSEKALPGSLKDFAKAYRLGTSGVQAGGKTIRPASYGDALLQTLGFAGVERERQTEGYYKLQEAIKNQPKTVQEQLKAKVAAKRANAYPMGTKPTPKNAALVREYERAYQ